MIFTIKLRGGLCNYLRVVFSYYEYARKNNLKLNVIWEKTNACPGYFEDYFEPIPGVSFIKDKNVKIDVTTWAAHKDHKPDYNKLILKPHIKKIIFNKINRLNKNYISVHIRRTDHIKQINIANKKWTTDEEFIDFLDNTKGNIYIATDNKCTYDKFKEKYQERIKFEYHKTNEKLLRKTSLQDAIVDIYMCIYSDNFKGSYHSSFSGLIDMARRSAGRDRRESFLKAWSEERVLAICRSVNQRHEPLSEDDFQFLQSLRGDPNIPPEFKPRIERAIDRETERRGGGGDEGGGPEHPSSRLIQILKAANQRHEALSDDDFEFLQSLMGDAAAAGLPDEMRRRIERAIRKEGREERAAAEVEMEPKSEPKPASD